MASKIIKTETETETSTSETELKECPICHSEFHPRGFASHLKACKTKTNSNSSTNKSSKATPVSTQKNKIRNPQQIQL